MPRNLGTALTADVKRDVIHPFLAMDLDFGVGVGVTRLWSGLGNITINGNTYLGAGSLGSVNAMQETAELRPIPLKLELSGIPAENVRAALENRYVGNECTIYFGTLTHTLAITGVYTMWKGRVDTMEYSDNERTAQISITVESRLIDFERARVRYYTPEDQKTRFPGDEGFAFVAGLQDRDIGWGRLR